MSNSFNIDEAVRQWLRSFRKHKAFSDGMIRELEVHLRDHIEDLQGDGYSDADAFAKAVHEFGDLKPMASEEFQNLRPGSVSNSIINTAMLKNYIKIAVRNFSNQKFYAFVNVFGLTMGFTIVFLIGLFVTDEFSFDQFNEHKADIYRVVENQYYADQPVFPVAVTPTALGPGLLAEYPEIINFTRFQGTNMYRFKLGEKSLMEDEGVLVDANFFSMFSYPILKGSIESFKENLNSIILSEELAEKYFTGVDPIGQSITLYDEDYIVAAVVANVRDDSHLNYRYFLNFDKYLADRPERADNWGSNWLYTYVQLSQDADHEALNAKIKDIIKRNNEGSVTDIYLQPLLDIYLGKVDFVVEVSRKGQMMYVKLFSIVAIFILIISCINFMNLATARGAKRAKEVGLRKTIGAYREQLMWQFMSESTLLTLISVVFSMVLLVVFLPVFNNLVNKQFELIKLFNSPNILFYIILVATTVFLTGVIAGSYPALYLSGMDPIVSINNLKTKGKKGAGLRKVLVVFQFVISVVLILGTIVIYKQLHFIQNADLGYQKDNIIYSFVPSDNAADLAAELRSETSIASAGLANRHPAYILSSTAGFSWQGKNPEDEILFHNMGCDEYYLETMQMDIINGRNFISQDTAAMIINEKAAEIMGFENPVGELVTYGDSEEYKIVGIVKDFNFKSIHTPIEPIVIAKMPSLNRIYIKYETGKKEEALVAAGKHWDKRYPEREFDYYFLEDDFTELYHVEQRTSKLASYFAAFAILISCLGLFGLVAFAAEQRTKEVGIRKVLGASVNNLFLLLTGDFTKLVFVSLIISLPLGWYVMKEWLESFAYRIDLTPAIFIYASVSAIAIAILTVSYQTLKVSFNNPVKALRNE